MRKIDPNKSITDVVIFDGSSNVQLAGELFKIHHKMVSVMRVVEHSVSLFFNQAQIPFRVLITNYIQKIL